MIWAMIFASSSPLEQFEHEPQQTNTAWRSGVAITPIREGGEAGPPHRMQMGASTLSDGIAALSGNRSEIGSNRRTTMGTAFGPLVKAKTGWRALLDVVAFPCHPTLLTTPLGSRRQRDLGGFFFCHTSLA